MRKTKQNSDLSGERIRQAALNLLSYRARSCGELREKLLAKGFATADIDGLLERFLEVGLLDDRKFGLDVAHYYLRTHPLGRFGLEQTLRVKGLTPDLAKEIADAELPPDTEVELAKKAIKRFINQDQNFMSKYKKVMGFLSRRGFSTHTINKIQAMLLKNREFEEFPEVDE